MRKKKYSRTDLIDFACENIEFFTTLSMWDKCARENKLPLSRHYKLEFGSWDKVKEEVYKCKSGENENRYSSEELLDIAKRHKRYFLKTRMWDTFAMEKNLPSSYIYIQVFGSWIEAKDKVHAIQSRVLWSDEEVDLFIQKHYRFMKSQTTWSSYADENELPSVGQLLYMAGFQTWGVFRSKAKLLEEKQEQDNKEELIKIALKHRDQFNTMREWSKYADMHNLPRVVSYNKYFGSWNKAKEKIFGKTG
ncbi:hypothetical protein QTG56_26010 (plasmid) [Rossellomorea sp. AcN35-11]|nr:hypothetical protein [Rossellomorea aquimaris]WJV32072.1 hypothetical protein QTG56_26010 [Rossellomorea sp. AcN35-11]